MQLSAAKLCPLPQSFVLCIYIMLHLEYILHHYKTHISHGFSLENINKAETTQQLATHYDSHCHYRNLPNPGNITYTAKGDVFSPMLLSYYESL